MRLPSEADLSLEQREICQAPLTGTSLVIGPPGSGKTVVAMFRKQAASKLGVNCEVAVHNRVLRRYAGLGNTFRDWLRKWWKTSTAGARMPQYRSEGRQWVVDFERASHLLMTEYREVAKSEGNWGHLILDEAQDFSQAAHTMLARVPGVIFCDYEPRGRPSMTILADENQRITDENSTLDEIIEAHDLLESEVYKLTKNYRNTREIAEVARYFHVGAGSGVPDLPVRRGNKPQLILRETSDQAVSRIVNYATLHPEEEIGVLVQYRNLQKRIYNKLKHQLSSTGLKVQLYDSKLKNEDCLAFDEPGTITVLCYSSSKGLEFDTVFLPELQALRLTGVDEDYAKMNLYVMCSRARSNLILMVSSDSPTPSSLWTLLPSGEEQKRLFDVE